MYDRYYRDQTQYSEEISVYESIRRNNRLLATFEPDQPAQGMVEQIEEIIHFVGRSLGQNGKQYTRGPVIEICQVTHWACLRST
jgi:hypothetical protein